MVNISSGGSFGEGQEPAVDAISKVALHTLTAKVSQAMRGSVKVNLICSGWVRTDMGGSGDPRPLEGAAETLVWLATPSKDGPNGGFFRDRKPIAW